MPGKSGGMGHAPSVMDTLMEIMQLIQQAKMLPDAAANMKFLQALEQGVIQYVEAKRKQDIQQATQGGQQQQGGPGGMPSMGGGGAGMGGMGGGGAAQQIGPGGGSGMSGFGTPNPDELRRVLAGPAAVGNGGS